MLNVEMLSTGDEVLHGQIVDTNAAWLADFFFNQGLPLTRRNLHGTDILLRHCAIRAQQAGKGVHPGTATVCQRCAE